MNKIVFSILLLPLITSCSKRVEEPKHLTTEEVKQTQVKETKYAVGQVWSYKTRHGEENSNIYIVKETQVEKLGTIYSIVVDGLSLKNPHIKGGIQDILPHAPVSVESLDASIVKHLRNQTTEFSDFSESYQTWKDAFDKGEGGVFKISVKQIIQILEDSVNK